jgi:hypothetical protein
MAWFNFVRNLRPNLIPQIDPRSRTAIRQPTAVTMAGLSPSSRHSNPCEWSTYVTTYVHVWLLLHAGPSDWAKWVIVFFGHFSEDAQILGLLCYTGKVMHQFGPKYWATYWAFFHKLIWSAWSQDTSDYKNIYTENLANSDRNTFIESFIKPDSFCSLKRIQQFHTKSWNLNTS